MRKKKVIFAPLNSTYMGISILGLLVSLYYLANPTIKIGQIFLSFFAIMFLIAIVARGKSSLPYMLSSVLGIIASIQVTLLPDESWGFTFLIFFGIMFISAVISMTKASPKAFVELESQ
jgi:hypothetical protein